MGLGSAVDGWAMADESAGENPAFPCETDVDAVLAEFGGDHRAAIRALLHDVAALAADYELSISRGYVRRSMTLTIGPQNRFRGMRDR